MTSRKPAPLPPPLPPLPVYVLLGRPLGGTEHTLFMVAKSWGVPGLSLHTKRASTAVGFDK